MPFNPSAHATSRGHLSHREIASIHRQDSSGHPGRFIARQIDRQSCNILWPAEPAGWDAQRLFRFWGKLHGGGSYTKPRHTMSAAARRKISLAQKARWAKAKGHAPRPKRTISAAGRRRIAAAQRARWAKVKAGKK